MRLCDLDAAQALSIQREEIDCRIKLVESGFMSIVIGKFPIVDLADVARGSIVAELHHRIAQIDDKLAHMGVIVDVDVV